MQGAQFVSILLLLANASVLGAAAPPPGGEGASPEWSYTSGGRPVPLEIDDGTLVVQTAELGSAELEARLKGLGLEYTSSGLIGPDSREGCGPSKSS